ncbi:SET domain-containing protein 4 [Ischnura elegans]|uniref:SET domain-containing protein 4 n=1 Tax=Ischnura elegans TaxID=197161 RepID=UPI001ED86844|nr:SET domain-containing protein 4 [Ischnura elegans]
MNGLQYHRRGRTSRRRCKRTLRTRMNNLSSDPSIIALVQWMCSMGWNATCKLRLVSNFFTGRGLQAVNGVKAGDVLVRIPERLLITASTVCNRLEIENVKVLLSEHGLLAVFIFLETQLGSDSPWFPYLQTLPKSFAVPSNCSDFEILSLPLFMQKRVMEQKYAIKTAFDNGCELITNLISKGKLPSSASVPTLSEFHHAWIVVNTRAVYMSCAADSLTCTILRDRDGSNLALAPYLDMFNHSFNAQVNAGFNKSTRCYEIRSQTKCPSMAQVFINYGPHDNMKLWIEYGFYLPGNPHEVITFAWDNIQAIVKRRPNSSITARKVEFLKGHGLLENLCCTVEGFSWGLSAIICVVCIEDCEISSYHKVFRGDWIPLESPLEIQFSLDLTATKRMEFIEARRRMLEVENSSDSFQIAIRILEEYIDILNKVEAWLEGLSQKKCS